MTFHIVNWAELVASVVATICLIIKPSRLNKMFVPFLWLTLCVEITGKLTSSIIEVKYPMYNIFILVEFLFYIYYLSGISPNIKIQKTFRWVVTCFILLFLYNFLLLQGTIVYNTYTSSISALMLVIACLIILWNISFNQNSNIQFYSSALFFVGSILVYNAGNLVPDSFFNYLGTKNPTAFVRLYLLINYNLNVLLYGCFTVGFLVELHSRNANKSPR